jgi:hypothetical protein
LILRIICKRKISYEHKKTNLKKDWFYFLGGRWGSNPRNVSAAFYISEDSRKITNSQNLDLFGARVPRFINPFI